MDFCKYDYNVLLEDIMLNDRAFDTHTTYIAHIYIGNPLMKVHINFKEASIKREFLIIFIKDKLFWFDIHSK